MDFHFVLFFSYLIRSCLIISGVTDNNDFIKNSKNYIINCTKSLKKSMGFSLYFTLCQIIWLVQRLRLIGLDVGTYQR